MNYFWDTFGKRITVGFVFVASLLAVTVFLTVNQLTKIRKLDDRIAQQRVPTAETSQKLLESVNQSLMELRGWIILGEPEFKIQRRNIWSKAIAPSLFKLETLSKNWTNPENVVRFRRLQTIIGELKTVQNEIEEISQNLDNMPVKQIFIKRASPLGEKIVGSLAQMIQQELEVVPDARKEVLQTLSNIQQAFTVALSNIRGYLKTGEPEHEIQFEKTWEKTRDQITALQALENQLTIQQRLEYKNFQKNFLRFQTLPQKMLELRNNEDWNLAKAWLGGRVTPLVKEIRSTLQAMVDNQIDLRNDDLKLSQEAMEKMKIMGISLLVVMVLLFPLLGIYISQSITNPITELISASNSIASGNFSTEIELGSTREMRSLKNSLTKMQENLLFERTKLEQNDWLQDSFAKVMVSLQGLRHLREFSETFLSSLTPLIQGKVAAFYLKEDENLDDLTPTFTLQATFAHPKPGILQERFKLGEGLIGQCARQKEPLLVNQVPKNYLELHSGLGHATPHNIILAPIIYEQKVLGVFEIGSFQEFTFLEQQLVERVGSNVGVIIANIFGNIKTESLLEESRALSAEYQAQSEEFQAQSEELKNANNELLEQSRLMDEKNRVLENTKNELEAKARELSMASKYKSEFLANMSHELRTPLNSLLVLSQLLSENKENNLTAKQIEFANTINKSGNALLSLLNDILDLSKIEAGKVEIQNAPIQLWEIQSHAEQNFQQIALKKNLKFSVEMPDGELPAFYSDISRILQIISNLLSNAFKFTEEGEVVLRVFRLEDDLLFNNPTLRQSDEILVFSVKDTGIGIPPEKQEGIFEEFQQADGSTTRKYGGTGLGLSICRELAKLLGGEIHLESEEDKGSVFSLYLPFRNTPGSNTNGPSTNINGRDQEETPPLDLIETKESQSFIDEKPGNNGLTYPDSFERNEEDTLILIVEDDVEFANVLVELAQNKGLKTLVANDGETALNLAKQHIPDGIILDIQIPLLNGWVVMDMLRRDMSTRHIPIHIISVVQDSGRALRMGATEYLEKPVNKNQLDDLFEHLKNSRRTTEKTLLLVESDPVQQEYLLNILNGYNYKIATASSSDQALNHLKDICTDRLILNLDIVNTPYQGFIETLKENPIFKNLKAIMHTTKELSREEENHLRTLSHQIIVRTDKFEERLIRELNTLENESARLFSVKANHSTNFFNPNENILKNKTVLIVDDDIRNIFALTSVLESNDMEVIFTQSGEETLDSLPDLSKLDVILMDIMMPGIDGYETTRRIRQMETFRDIPIIAVTAKAMKEDRQHCLEAGASDYITKPVDVERLLSLLRIWTYS